MRLTCPVCETRLKVSEGIERFACLNCGAELKVEREGDLFKVLPTQDSAARMTASQQQLIEVNSALKAADDNYGVGCAIATMGITLVACIVLALAIVVQSQPLFWAAIAVALVLLGFVLFMFLTASSRGIDPLLRKRDRLQAQVEAEQVPDDDMLGGSAPQEVETETLAPTASEEEAISEARIGRQAPAPLQEAEEPAIEPAQSAPEPSPVEPPPPRPPRAEPLG